MLQYLDSLTLPTEEDEAGYILDTGNPHMNMTDYDPDNVYPFGIFGARVTGKLRFSNITVLCGSNGSGKSTLLNVIAEALGLERVSEFNKTHHFASYISMCGANLTYGKKLPSGSAVITSDDVFDALLSRRRKNDGIGKRRDELSEEYFALRYREQNVTLRSLSSEDEARFRRKNAANRKTPSRFIAGELGGLEARGNSNGQEAFRYFIDRTSSPALYLIDEPENSLSPMRQLDLSRYIESSARGFDCQFVIATHSPFFAAINGALVYDLDAEHICAKKWSELGGMRTYARFFGEHMNEF